MPTYDTAPDRVDVTVDAGDVHVITGTADGATVTVSPADPGRNRDVQAADATEVSMTDGRLVVRTVEVRGLGRLVGPTSRTGAVAVVIEVPDGVDLDVTGQVTAIRVDGRVGRATVRTQVGAIHLDRTTDVAARTSGGDVTIGRVDGTARVQGLGTIRIGHLTGAAGIRNMAGPIEVGDAEGSVRLRSGTGDLVVDTAAADLDARTGTGSITVGAASSGLVELRTPTGSIRVGVPEGTSVLLDATTKLGRVEQHLAASDGPAPGDRRVEVRAHTSLGDVVVHRA